MKIQARSIPTVVLIVMMSVFSSGVATAQSGPGDFNGDLKIDTADILILQRHLRGDTLPGNIDLGPGFRYADLAPWNSSNGISTPDDVIDSADLLVLMARVRAGDNLIAQAPGPATLNVPSSLLAPNETTQNPFQVAGTTDANTLVELFVNGIFQEDIVSDVNGDFAFGLYLNAHAEGVYDSFFVHSKNGSGSGLDSAPLLVDYYDQEVRDACLVDDMTTIVPLRSGPGPNSITLSSDETYVVTRGVDKECINSVVRNYQFSISVFSGGTLVFMPGSELGMAEVAQPIFVNAGRLLMLGQPNDRVTVRGDFADKDSFSGFRIQISPSTRIEYTDIFNTVPSFGSTGFTIGPGPLSGFIDSSVVSIVDSYIGYQNLFNGSNPIETGENWTFGGIYVDPGAVVSFLDSQIVGGGPVSDASTSSGITLSEAGDYDVTIDGTTVALFKTGLLLSQASVNDPEVPTSIQVVGDSRFYANETGIAVQSDSRAFVENSTIEGNCRGLWSVGGAPLLEGNTISGNFIGIEITGGSTKIPQSLPVIRNNDLSGNENVASIPGFASPTCPGNWVADTIKSRVSRVAGSADLLDLSQNYWGTEIETEVHAKVHQDVFNIDTAVPFDVSQFTDMFGGVVGPVFSVNRAVFDLRTFGSVGPEQFFDPVAAETGTLEFTTPSSLGEGHSQHARVRIYPEAAFSQSSGEGVVVDRLIGDTGSGVTGAVGPGLVSFPWDGRDDSGKLVPDEAYVFDLEIVAAVGTDVFNSYPPDGSSSFQPVNLTDLTPEGSGGTDDRDPISVFSGEPLSIPIYVGTPLASNNSTGARLQVNVDLVPSGVACGDPSTRQTEIPVLSAFLPSLPGDKPYQFEVPFRHPAPNNSLFVQNPDSGWRPRPNLAPGEAFCVAAPVIRPLWEPNLVVQGAQPIISGVQTRDDVPETNRTMIRVEPYIVQQSYDQVVHFDLCLSQEADITFKILKPTFNNPTTNPAEIQTILADGVRYSAKNCAIGVPNDPNGPDGFHHFVWTDMVDPADAIHTFVIEATSTNPDLRPEDATTTYRGFLDLRP